MLVYTHVPALIVALLLTGLHTCQAFYKLPADVPVTGGTAQNAVCGPCCENDVYCGTMPSSVYITGSTQQVAGAVDSGLCVPQTHAAGIDGLPQVEDFCRMYDRSLSPSYTLANVIYQANLVTQDDCGPCCDGYHVCDVNSICRPTTGAHAVCVPASATKSKMCGTSVDLTQDVACESCEQPSPAAKLFEDVHTTSRRLLQMHSGSASRKVFSVRWQPTST